MKKLLSTCTVIGALFWLFTTEVNAQITINEFMPDSSQEWTEFYNSSPSADFIKSYYIDDDTDFLSDSGSSAKKLLTTLNVSNPTFPTIDTSSFLNNSGDWVVLFDQNGVVLDQYQFNSNPGKDISIGRYPDSIGSFSILNYATKADANSTPPTPVPTPTTTPVPATSVPTPTITPTPTKTPTPKATRSPTPEPTTEVLGVGTFNPAPSPTAASAEKKESENQDKFPLIAVILILSGLAFIGGSCYMAFGKKGKAPGEKSLI
ncbi:MAG: hypothetical protein UU12_C0009G0014 [Candidatus Woesebacteria bacterium GW2011_GWA2_40_7b]|uniref:Uncharacterized protein n=1 Tax=Candidatus Woesebacteria bacterium GW2011_GWA2_40_7b TaxID=1618563 RepID=A0A0G0VG74_9BACT|nr:MAG: hypothetical protein UU12_C0009G0014 [Candidatus Woesebacteria bacterium GW2011_GWA2_40_7b]